MVKYIDAEKLKAEIEKLKKKARKNALIARDNNNTSVCALWSGKEHICTNILSIITSLQHEQPEMGLDKFTEKIKTFQGRYKHPEIVSIKGAMAFMARMFYQYPNVARQWYESLPKATMD